MNQASDTVTSDITVRQMRPEERSEVREMFRRSFPLLLRLFFSWTPHTLVAERGGKLVGAIMLKTYPLPGGRKGGFVSWIFTAPEARGTGAGRRLIEAALDLFESQGCDEAAACVEGYNASSAKLFSTRGFSILSPGEQLRRYGLGVLPTWVRMSHVGDIGQFVWVRPGAARPDSPSLQWWGTLLVNTLIALLVLWRSGGLNPLAFVAVPLMFLLFFGARWLAMRWTAAARGLEVRFRAWETGLLVSLGVALVLGGLFPVPGGVYPVSSRWSYRTLLPKLGPVALAGVLPTLLLTGAAWGLARFAGLPPGLDGWIGYVLFVGGWLALFDVVLVFWPFVSFNGRRIWDWNRPLWAVLALTALAVFLT